jgi:hypothetical protein
MLISLKLKPAATAGTLLTVVTISTLCAGGVATGDETDPTRPAAESRTLMRVFANWRARATRVKSFHFTWDAAVGIPKGVDDRTWQHLHPDALPPKTTRNVKYLFRQCEFWLEGDDHFRLEKFVVSHHRDGSTDVKSRHQSTFDGTHDRSVMLPGSSTDHPRGSIRNIEPTDFWPTDESQQTPRMPTFRGANEGRYYELDAATEHPLWLTFRPFPPVLDWDPEHCSVVAGPPKNDLVLGASCVGEFMSRRAATKSSRRYRPVLL